MDKRGLFDVLLENGVYSESKKVWYVELQQVHMFWYELLMDNYQDYETKKMIKEFVKGIKKQMENCLNKRFIYFICSRKKVRFSVKKKPKYNFSGNKLNLFLEIGKRRKLKKISILVEGFEKRPEVEVEEKFITFINQFGGKTTMSIHDFLLNTNSDLGLKTEVHYVGYTKNPDTRPINGRHMGLNDILHRTSNEDNDILIYFNVFKVICYAVNPDYLVNFAIANSMIDEIKTDVEGKILEKCFIAYFNAENQFRNKVREKGELKNRLKKLAIENNIESVQIKYELNLPNEYYAFCSTKVKPSTKHMFTVALCDKEPKIQKGLKFYSQHFRPFM